MHALTAIGLQLPLLVMAESGEPLQTDYFNIGSRVWCRTCHDDDVNGEVLAFDPQAKMLVLKCPSSQDKPNVCNVNVVNLSLVRELVVEHECTANPPPLTPLNTTRLTKRLKDNIDEKHRQVAAQAQGVSPVGQSLYLAITKTIGEVSWQGTDMMVLGKVVVSAPYTVNDVKGKPECPALVHVRKLVEKHSREQMVNNSNAFDGKVA